MTSATNVGVSKLETDIDVYLHTEDGSVVAECANDIKCGRLKLVDFVTGLGRPLISKETQPRRRGMQLLTDVVRSLPLDFLADAEVALLVEFFCARLGDHHSITPISLAGLAPFVSHRSLAGADLARILRCIFSEVTVQTLVQSDRLLVYEMFDRLLADRSSDLQSTLNVEFVSGLVQAIDSEKDPRNLLVTLGLVSTVARKLSLDGVAEELFEVIGCYYPIDFSPPLRSDITVTREQLENALLDAMTATPAFAPFCLPLLLEKLASSVVDAKLSSLRTLMRCCDVFARKDLADHAADFWGVMRTDVFAQRDQVEDMTLMALTMLARCLSSADDKSTGSSAEFEAFAKAILDDCGKYLHEPEQAACRQAGKLLSAVCRASLPGCVLVTEHAMPLLVAEFHLRTQSSQRHGLLEVLVSLLRSGSSVTLDCESPLLAHKDSLTSIFITLLSSTDSLLRCDAILGIAALLAHPALLNVKECEMLTEHLIATLLSDVDFAVRQECTSAVAFVANKDPSIISKSVLPDLFGLLLGSPVADIQIGQHADACFVFDTIASVSVHLSLVVETIPILLQHIVRVLEEPSVFSGDGRDETASSALSRCCSRLTSVTATMSTSCSEFFVTTLAPCCVSMLLHARLSSMQHVARSHAVERGLIGTVRQIVQQSKGDSSALETFVSSIIYLFFSGDVLYFRNCSNTLLPGIRLLDQRVSIEQNLVLDLLMTVVCSSPYNIIAPSSDQLMNQLLTVMFDGASDGASSSAYRCLAGLINRRPKDAYLDDLLQQLLFDIDKFSSSDSGSKLPACNQRLDALNICIWVTKSLVLRNYPLQSSFLQFVVDSLADRLLAATAANGFRLILSDDAELMDHVFTAHANITLMYRQRFFTLTFPQLMERYSTAEQEAKCFYVLALMQLVQFVPRDVLEPEVPRLLPVLIQSLMSEDPSMWPGTIETLTELAADNSYTLHPYIDDLIPRLLTLCVFKASMKVRMAALRCVSELASMPTHLIVPQTGQVLHYLGLCLDDHKRLVRQEAASARSKWYLVG